MTTDATTNLSRLDAVIEETVALETATVDRDGGLPLLDAQ